MNLNRVHVTYPTFAPTPTLNFAACFGSKNITITKTIGIRLPQVVRLVTSVVPDSKVAPKVVVVASMPPVKFAPVQTLALYHKIIFILFYYIIYYLLFIIYYYLLFFIYYLLFIIYYLLFILFYFILFYFILFIILFYYLLFIIYYLLFIIY